MAMSSTTSQHEIYDGVIHLLYEWTGEIATSPTLTDETSELTATVSNEIVTKSRSQIVRDAENDLIENFIRRRPTRPTNPACWFRKRILLWALDIPARFSSNNYLFSFLFYKLTLESERLMYLLKSNVLY